MKCPKIYAVFVLFCLIICMSHQNMTKTLNQMTFNCSNTALAHYLVGKRPPHGISHLWQPAWGGSSLTYESRVWYHANPDCVVTFRCSHVGSRSHISSLPFSTFTFRIHTLPMCTVARLLPLKYFTLTVAQFNDRTFSFACSLTLIQVPQTNNGGIALTCSKLCTGQSQRERQSEK